MNLELVNLRASNGRVRFVVKNTGPFGAAIEYVLVETAGQDPEIIGLGCWRQSIYLGTQEDSRILDGDDLGYCAPFTTSTPDVLVGITVFFVDDRGERGSAQATTRTTP